MKKERQTHVKKLIDLIKEQQYENNNEDIEELSKYFNFHLENGDGMVILSVLREIPRNAEKWIANQ